MKKKLISALLITAMTTTVMIGCSGTPANTFSAPAKTVGSASGATLAFICKDLSQEWFVGTSSSMKETAIARGAKDFIMYDCGMSPDKYMTALDTAISLDVDVLIVCPPDQNLSQITVQRCKEAGIKVMADDDGLIDENGTLLAPSLELDARVGQGIGEYLAKYVIDTGINKDYTKVSYLCMTMSEVSSCIPRSTGARDKFTEIVTDFPTDKIIEADYDGTSDKGFNVAAAAITANLDIDVWLVTAPNDEGALGATRALEQAGKDKESIVIGVGGYLAKDEFKKDFSCFKATAYIDPVLDGQLAANAAMDWLETGKVPYSEYVEEGNTFGLSPFSATLVDSSNYKEIMGDDAN